MVLAPMGIFGLCALLVEASNPCSMVNSRFGEYVYIGAIDPNPFKIDI